MIRNRQLAFTLCEVVISLGLFTFALTALLGVLPAAMSVGRNSMDEAMAGRLAEEASGAARRLGGMNEQWFVDNFGKRVSEGESPVYRVRVETADSELSERLKRLKVTVWRFGETQSSRVFSSLVFLDEP